MSSKVVFLKYLAPSSPAGALGSASCSGNSVSQLHQQLQTAPSIGRTAIVIKRLGDGLISIQGYPPVHHSEKHKAWTIFQQAAKQLLGISNGTPICTRFSDPPYETVGSLSAIFHQTSHLINLLVQPICSSSSSSDNFSRDAKARNRLSAVMEVSVGGRDPYSVFREQYCSSDDSSVELLTHASDKRRKCDFAEMNRLVSQLSEVNLYLQRTKQECELIEERCSRKSGSGGGEAKVETSSSSESSKSAASRKFRNSVSNSSHFSDSGKGSMEDYEVLENVREREEEEGEGEGTDSSTLQETDAGVELRRGQEVRDKEVDRLLEIAQRLTQQMLLQEQQEQQHWNQGTTPSAVIRGTQDTPPRPEAPSQVLARPSFRHGGAYIMWDPVSIDGEERNCGLKVLGYQVHLDGSLHERVGGALTSQLEVMGMQDHGEYRVQVCTECEGSCSPLTEQIIYRHCETNQLLAHTQDVATFSVNNQPELTNTSSNLQCPGQSAVAMTTTHVSNSNAAIPAGDAATDDEEGGAKVAPPTTPSHSNHCKVARVHFWLKHSPPHPSSSDHTHSHDPTHLQDHAQPQNHTPPLHVHFAEEEEICGCADDAKSTGSSHTSGIVTDFPSSPKLLLSSPKLLPSCSCPQCSDSSGNFSMTTTTTQAHDELSMCRNNKEPTPSDSGTDDTVIDMPPSVIMDTSPHPRPHPLHSSTTKDCKHISKLLSCSANRTAASKREWYGDGSLGLGQGGMSKPHPFPGRSGGKMVTKNGMKKFVVAPEPPTNVVITRAGKRNCYIVSWSPARRDQEGCSNGLHVLGYRVYVEGSCWKSVDGALTVQAYLTLPSTSTMQLKQQQVDIHIRTRSMSAESAPSAIAVYRDSRYKPRSCDKLVTAKNHLLSTYV